MNPLLKNELLPDFHAIQAEHVVPAITSLLADAQAVIDNIAAQESPAYETAVLALDRATEPLDVAMSVVKHLEGVRTTPEFRAAVNEVEPRVSEFYSSIPLNQALWDAVRRTASPAESVHARYWKKTLDGFRRHGADLSPDDKDRLRQLDVEETLLSTKFSENVLDSMASWELVIEDEATLAGLPESARAAARQSAEAKGVAGWRFTLQQPSYVPVMTYLNDRSIRERMYRAYNVRATEAERDNRPLIPRLLAIRQERAKLLGFQNFADLVTEDRMAKSGQGALEFLTQLETLTRPFFEREKASLEAFAAAHGAPLPLEPWDVGYWAEKQRIALYDFDREQLRPYFSVDRVMLGMFRIFEGLFAIRIAERPDVAGWHPDVKAYEIRTADGRLCGIFYADWFPREDKRPGAWMDCLRNGGPAASGFDPHIGLICGNLTPPVGDRPALMTHEEVETIFHEFGHLLHQLLSTVEVRSLTGTHVAWDFVELPSQLFQNWCWERESLDAFARHVDTGEPLPEALLDRMKRARTFRAATAQMRQLSFGIADLKLHMEYDPERDGDVIAYTREVLERFSAAPFPPEHAMFASFTHLFSGGYGAGYYSYKWAEVLDADAFSRFRKEGVHNATTGAAFRDTILSRGNSEEPGDLYRAFMGRDPDPRALLERDGLLT